MDDAYVKHLRGDSPGSNVMETTYRHLSDDDAKSAEEQIQADVKQDYAETDPGDEQQDKIDTLDELLDDPRGEGGPPRADGRRLNREDTRPCVQTVLP